MLKPFTVISQVFALRLLLATGLLGGGLSCAQKPKKAATPAADDQIDNSSVDGSVQQDTGGSNASGSGTAAVTGDQRFDPSCATKEACRPAVVDILIDAPGGKLTGSPGQMATWKLTAVDTGTLGGVSRPLPSSSDPASAPASPSPDPTGAALLDTTGVGSTTPSLASALASAPGLAPQQGPVPGLGGVPAAAAPGTTPLAAAFPGAIAAPGALAAGTGLGAGSSRHVVMILGGLPAEATVSPFSLGKPLVTATITWIPTVPGTGNLTVILRDFDRCFLTEADPSVCERSTPLAAYDTQHAPIPIIIGTAQPACKKKADVMSSIGQFFGGGSTTGC